MFRLSFYRNCCSFTSLIRRQSISMGTSSHTRRLLSSRSKDSSEGEKWNDAWETAWLPDDLSGKKRAPWETDVNFSISSSTPDLDADTKAFVEDMADNWEQRRKKSNREEEEERLKKLKQEQVYSLENVKKDYRVQKQRVHASLWVKEIEKMEEAKLAGSAAADDGLDRFLDTASEIFESGSTSDLKGGGDMKSKADGWETTGGGGKGEDGNLWDISQREEDILVQEYERRIAFCKFQIGSFIKQHIFSRRRPIDGWKYMIEELGPNARRKGGGGSVSRLPSLADPATQPFKEDNNKNIPISTTNTDTDINRRRRR